MLALKWSNWLLTKQKKVIFKKLLSLNNPQLRSLSFQTSDSLSTEHGSLREMKACICPSGKLLCLWTYKTAV